MCMESISAKKKVTHQCLCLCSKSDLPRTSTTSTRNARQIINHRSRHLRYYRSLPPGICLPVRSVQHLRQRTSPTTPPYSHLALANFRRAGQRTDMAGRPSGRQPQRLPYGRVRELMSVPARFAGVIIGKAGETVKDMQKRTGCKIFVAHQLSGRDDCTVVLTGTVHAVDRAFRLLSDEVPGACPQQRASTSSRMLQPLSQKAIPSLVQLTLKLAAKQWPLFDEDEISLFTGLPLHLRLHLIDQLELCGRLSSRPRHQEDDDDDDDEEALGDDLLEQNSMLIEHKF